MEKYSGSQEPQSPKVQQFTVQLEKVFPNVTTLSRQGRVSPAKLLQFCSGPPSVTSLLLLLGALLVSAQPGLSAPGKEGLT